MKSLCTLTIIWDKCNVILWKTMWVARQDFEQSRRWCAYTHRKQCVRILKMRHGAALLVRCVIHFTLMPRCILKFGNWEIWFTLCELVLCTTDVIWSVPLKVPSSLSNPNHKYYRQLARTFYACVRGNNSIPAGGSSLHLSSKKRNLKGYDCWYTKQHLAFSQQTQWPLAFVIWFVFSCCGSLSWTPNQSDLSHQWAQPPIRHVQSSENQSTFVQLLPKLGLQTLNDNPSLASSQLLAWCRGLLYVLIYTHWPLYLVHLSSTGLDPLLPSEPL